MQQFRVAEAIRAYQEGRVDLHAAAEGARLPIAVLLEEMAARKVAVLEDADTDVTEALLTSFHAFLPYSLFHPGIREQLARLPEEVKPAM